MFLIPLGQDAKIVSTPGQVGGVWLTVAGVSIRIAHNPEKGFVAISAHPLGHEDEELDNFTVDDHPIPLADDEFQ